MSVLSFIAESLNKSIVQFLGWHFRCDLCVVVLWIAVTPLIIVVPAELSRPIFLCNSGPSMNKLSYMACILPLFRIKTEYCPVILLCDCQAIPILQSKQSMHLLYYLLIHDKKTRFLRLLEL